MYMWPQKAYHAIPTYDILLAEWWFFQAVIGGSFYINMRYLQLSCWQKCDKFLGCLKSLQVLPSDFVNAKKSGKSKKNQKKRIRFVFIYCESGGTLATAQIGATDPSGGLGLNGGRPDTVTFGELATKVAKIEAAIRALSEREVPKAAVETCTVLNRDGVRGSESVEEVKCILNKSFTHTPCLNLTKVG